MYPKVHCSYSMGMNYEQSEILYCEVDAPLRQNRQKETMHFRLWIVGLYRTWSSMV